MKKLLILLTTISLFACNDELEFDKSQKAMIGVSGIACPTGIAIDVYRAVPASEVAIEHIEDNRFANNIEAQMHIKIEKILLYENNVLIDTISQNSLGGMPALCPYNNSFDYYYLGKQLNENSTYTIEIVSQDYGTAIATFKLPRKVYISSYSENNNVLTFTINDDASENNYYGLESTLRNIGNNGLSYDISMDRNDMFNNGGYKLELVPDQIMNKIIDKNENCYTYIFSDKTFNGKSFKFYGKKIENPSYPVFNYETEEYEEVEEIDLDEITTNIYLCTYSKEVFMEMMNAKSKIDNTEYVTNNFNIENGVGYIASYNYTENQITIKLK